MADRYTELFGRTSAMHPDDLALIEHHLGGVGGTVLDAGCGPGHVAAHLRGHRVDVVGLDLTPALLAHARTADPRCPLVLASLVDLPVGDDALGGVVAWYSLIHLPPGHLDGALAELRRVVEPGAALVVGFFDGPRIEPFPHKVATAWYWPVDALAERLRAAGFAEVERQRRPEVPDPFTRAHAALVATAI